MKINLAGNNSKITESEESITNEALINSSQAYQFHLPFECNFAVGLPIEEQQRIVADAYMQQVKTYNSLIRTEYEYSQKAQLSILTESLKENTLQRTEEIRQKRELLSYSIIENSEGCLCKELISADGRTIGVKPITKKRKIRLCAYYSHPKNDKDKVYVIHWEASEREIRLVGENATPDKLDREFSKAGIAFQTSREYRKNLMDQVFSYLVSHASEIEIPRSYGWNKMSTGEWIFARRNIDKTIRGMMENV